MKKPRLALLLALMCALALSMGPCLAACDDGTSGSAGTTSTSSGGSGGTQGSGSGPLTAWTDLAPTGDLPAVRAGHSMVYDPKTGKVLLFGGTDSKVFYDDTWAYDPATNTWTELATGGDRPPARCAAAMVYDSAGGRALLFGGTGGEAFLNDMWAYDPASDTWAEVQPVGDPPSVRVGHAMVYDSANGTVIMYGGRNEDGFFDETWTYDIAANTWSLVQTAGDAPTERYGHSMVYEPASGKAIVTGGWDSIVYLSSTWAYDPKTKSWTSLDTSGAVPSPRAGHTVIHDPGSGSLVLFGGTDGSGFFSDTRTYDPDTGAWTLLEVGTAHPAGRNGHAMAYVPTSGTVILFGGWDGTTYYNDTWSLDGEN